MPIQINTAVKSDNKDTSEINRGIHLDLKVKSDFVDPGVEVISTNRMNLVHETSGTSTIGKILSDDTYYYTLGYSTHIKSFADYIKKYRKSDNELVLTSSVTHSNTFNTAKLIDGYIYLDNNRTFVQISTETLEIVNSYAFNRYTISFIIVGDYIHLLGISQDYPSYGYLSHTINKADFTLYADRTTTGFPAVAPAILDYDGTYIYFMEYHNLNKMDPDTLTIIDTLVLDGNGPSGILFEPGIIQSIMPGNFIHKGYLYLYGPSSYPGALIKIDTATMTVADAMPANPNQYYAFNEVVVLPEEDTAYCAIYFSATYKYLITINLNTLESLEEDLLVDYNMLSVFWGFGADTDYLYFGSAFSDSGLQVRDRKDITVISRPPEVNLIEDAIKIKI